MALTAKKEAFAQAVVAGLSQSDAYRSAYSVRAGTKPESVNQAASKLMADPNIASRVSELRKPVAQAAQLTLARHLERLADLSDKAEKEGKYSAAVAAEVARGKASGLYIEKVEHSGGVTVTASALDERL